MGGDDPKLRESDTHSYKGRITKQGSTIVRWAAMECVVRTADVDRIFHALADGTRRDIVALAVGGR